MLRKPSRTNRTVPRPKCATMCTDIMYKNVRGPLNAMRRKSQSGKSLNNRKLSLVKYVACSTARTVIDVEQFNARKGREAPFSMESVNAKSFSTLRCGMNVSLC
jgi:hypothetical protein